MKFGIVAALILFALLPISTENVYSSSNGAQMSSQSTLSKNLVETAEEVLLEAAEFGLDWAGEKLLGSKGWEGFKRILNPVVVKLQEKFPGLKFGKANDTQSIETAREAVNYLRQDPELHNLLLQGFINLEEGQQEILSSVNRLEKLVEARHDEEMRLLKQMDEKLSNTDGLPVKIDVSDIVDRIYLLSKIRAKREGREFNKNVSGLVAVSAGEGVFSLRVLEEGKAFVRYETEMSNAKWYATPSSQFHDSEGRLCRKLSIDTPVWGEPGKRFIIYSKYCQVEGGWKPVELLEKKEYFE